MKKLLFAVITLSLTASLTSCASMSAVDYSKLENKKYTFTHFQYYNKGKTNDYAFSFMQSFPLNKVLDLIAKEYGIEIDTKGYDTFIEKGSSKPIQSFNWGPINAYFDWEIKDYRKIGNRVEFFFHYKEDLEYNTLDIDYELAVYTGGKRSSFFAGRVHNNDEVVTSLAKALAEKKKEKR